MYALIISPMRADQIYLALSGDNISFDVAEILNSTNVQSVFQSAARVTADALILDLDVADPGVNLVDGVKMYRIQRPQTRIIILVPDREPGDLLVSQLFSLGVYDIVSGKSESDWTLLLTETMKKPPGDFAQAARWYKPDADGSISNTRQQRDNLLSHLKGKIKIYKNEFSKKDVSRKLSSKTSPDANCEAVHTIERTENNSIANTKTEPVKISALEQSSENIGNRSAGNGQVQEETMHTKENEKSKFTLWPEIKPIFSGIISRLKPVPKGEIPNLVVIWSPAPAGKTFIAFNLASAYTSSGYRTVLVSNDTFAGWSVMVQPVPVLKKYTGILPSEMLGLTILQESDINDYRDLTCVSDMVVVDSGSRDVMRYAGQVILVVNQDNLEQISAALEQDELDWSKVWIIANGVTEDNITYVEDVIRLKVDYVVPFMSVKEKDIPETFYYMLKEVDSF